MQTSLTIVPVTSQVFAAWCASSPCLLHCRTLRLVRSGASIAVAVSRTPKELSGAANFAGMVCRKHRNNNVQPAVGPAFGILGCPRFKTGTGTVDALEFVGASGFRWKSVPVFASFPGSGLGTHVLEALLRRVPAGFRIQLMHRRSPGREPVSEGESNVNRRSRASGAGVPKPEFGNEWKPCDGPESAHVGEVACVSIVLDDLTRPAVSSRPERQRAGVPGEVAGGCSAPSSGLFPLAFLCWRPTLPDRCSAWKRCCGILLAGK